MEAADYDSNNETRHRETFGPPTRVSTTTSGSAQSSEADTRGTGGRFQTKYSPGSRVSLDEEDLDGSKHSQDCFIEFVSDAKDARFDVVFVHGLSGDYRTTWQCGDEFWPRYISTDIPQSRVVLFGYNTQIWSDSSFGAAEDTARHLVRLLTESRIEGHSGRPIIWIAHSMGGFLVKAACVLGSGSKSDAGFSNVFLDDSIDDFTKGIIFFGTPHRALSLGGWPVILQRIYNTAHEYSDNIEPKQSFELAETLGLLQLFDKFEQSLGTSNAQIFSFYERHETFGESLPVLVTSLENAFFHRSESRDILPGNHVSMCRFQGRNDYGYLQIKRIITDIFEGLPQPTIASLSSKSMVPSSDLERNVFANLKDLLEIRSGTSSHNEDDLATIVPPSIISQFAITLKLRRLKRFLAFPNYRVSRHLGTYPVEPYQESTKWALDTPEFQEWLASEHILVLHGPLGSGKSALAFRIAHYLQEQIEKEATNLGSRRYVLSYFFDNLIEPEYTVVQILHQFLLQFLEISPSLVRHFPTARVFSRPRVSWPTWDEDHTTVTSFKKISSHAGDSKSSGHHTTSEFNHRQLVIKMFTMMELTEILISILHDDQIEKVFFVIDGLDYSLQQCQSQFHYFLGLLNALSLKNTKICLTHHSKLDVSSLKQVIHLDIGQKLHRAHWASENAIDRIRSNLRDEIYRNDSTSVMMELQEVFQVISERKGQSFLPEILLRRALGSLRQSHYLREFVQFMHKWSETEVHNETLQINDIYSWILPRIHSATQNELTLTQLLFLVSLAARPLTVNEAIELLPRPKLDQTSSALYENLPPNDLRMNIEPDQIEDDTFGLLRLDNGIITICHPSLKVFIVAYLERSHLKSFMEYQIGISCLRLLNHLRKSTAVGDTTYDWGRRAHSVSVDLYSYAFKYWSRHLVASHSASKWKPADSEPILSALKDLWTDESMRCLMHEFSRANFPRNSSFPLSCLLAGYNLWSVLEAWFYSEPSKKALDYLSLEEKCAAANSAEGSLKILQKHGYDSTFPDNKERTVEDYKRWVASENIKENFFLPDWAYNSLGEDQQDGRRDEKAIWSDFYESIKNNSSGPIEQLKSKGLLQQSLALSVRRCDIQLARQLLRHGANPNYVDKDDPQLPSILHLAAATGDFKLVKRLLVFGCRSSVTDRLGMRPIHWAAERGHFQVVQLLVSPSADLDDKFGRNPLFMACESTSAQTVRVLLKFGSNINLQDKAGRTPLHAAASTGALDMVRLLLSRGASPGAQDRKGICPLHVGAYGGWVGVVEELLAWGVPVDVPSKSKQTALHFACKSLNPSLEVVSTLLQQQSNPNAQDSKGHTPLQIAVRGGSYAIVDILLKATDCDPRSPELRVFARGNASLLDLLQEHISDQPAGSMLNAEPSGNPADGPLVNVVFVHGFHRTQWETWSNSQTFWPMDYLRTDMANARIICWDHRYESADFSSFDNVQRLARKLLEYVIDSASSSNSNTSAERPIRSSRWFASPLVFVGHSLGGLIIKLALDIAAKDDDFASINVNIKGVVLLGTPHYVPDEDLYLNVFSQLVLSATSQRLAPLFWRPPRPLNKDGPWFAHDIHKHESLEKDFTRICMLKEISVLSIMEEGSSRGGEQVVPSRISRYDLPLSRSQVSQRNHENLGKFSSPDDVIYKTIRGFVREIAFRTRDAARGGGVFPYDTNTTWEIADSKEQDDVVERKGSLLIEEKADSRHETDGAHLQETILSTLRASVVIDDQITKTEAEITLSSLLPSRDNSISETRNPVNTWLCSPDEKSLWITGKPGSGKSTLMRQIFRHALTPELLEESFQVDKSHIILAAFHFARDKHRQSPEDMLRTLVYQIFSAQGHLIVDVFGEADDKIDWVYSWEQLRAAFFDAVRPKNSQKALKYCIFIDAMEECQPHTSNGDYFYELICKFVLSCLNLPNLKICVSSRPLTIFVNAFHSMPRVLLHNYNKHDIEIFVKTRLLEASQRTGLDTDELAKAVIEKAQGVTLWAALTVDSLVRGIEFGDSDSELQKRLDSTPSDLYDVYGRMLADIPKIYLKETWRIFRLILSVPRQVNLVLLSLAEEDYLEKSPGQEMPPKSNLHAINEPLVNSALKDEPQLTRTEKRMERRMKSRCADFLEVRETGEVQFIHRTAQAFISEAMEGEVSRLEDPDFDPLLNLLSGCIIRLKRLLPRHSIENRAKYASDYIAEALNYAMCADSGAKDRQSYIRLVDELSNTCLKLSSLEKALAPPQPKVPRVHTDASFEKVSPEQYSSLLAIRTGLWKYVLGTVTQISAELEDNSGRSLLLHAINRQDLRTIPWAQTISDNWDLPPVEVVRALLELRCDPNQSWHGQRNVWGDVLEAGYHCFSEDMVPVRPGPPRTVSNCEKWVDIMDLFISHGAHIDARFKVDFHSRGSNLATAPPVRKVISPKFTLVDNLKCQRLYETRFKQLLEAVRSTKSKSLQTASRPKSSLETFSPTDSPRQSIFRGRLSRSHTMQSGDDDNEQRQEKPKGRDSSRGIRSSLRHKLSSTWKHI